MSGKIKGKKHHRAWCPWKRMGNCKKKSEMKNEARTDWAWLHTYTTHKISLRMIFCNIVSDPASVTDAVTFSRREENLDFQGHENIFLSECTVNSHVGINSNKNVPLSRSLSCFMTSNQGIGLITVYVYKRERKREERMQRFFSAPFATNSLKR